MIEQEASTAPIVGVAIGILWITLISREPAQDLNHSWLIKALAWISMLWLAALGPGTISIMPIAEELAFRGFLNCEIISLK